MTLINDETEFLNLVNIKDNLIIFCYHGWSGYSRVAKQIVESWEIKFNREIKLIDATDMEYENYFLNWLAQKETSDWAKEGIMRINRFSPKSRLHGYGEICWIANKEVVGFECIFNTFNLEALEERTLNLFS